MVDTLMALGAVANPYRGSRRFARPRPISRRRRNASAPAHRTASWRRAASGLIASVRKRLPSVRKRPARSKSHRAKVTSRRSTARMTTVLKHPARAVRRATRRSATATKRRAAALKGWRKRKRATTAKSTKKVSPRRKTKAGSRRKTTMAKAKRKSRKSATAGRRRTKSGRFAKTGRKSRKTKARTARKSPRKTRKWRSGVARRRRVGASKRSYRKGARRLARTYRAAAKGRRGKVANRRRRASKTLIRAARRRLPNPSRRRRGRGRRRNPFGGGLVSGVMATATRALVIGGGFFGGRLAANYVRKLPLKFFQEGAYAPTLTATAIFTLAWFAVPKGGKIGKYRDDLLIGLGLNVLDQGIKWLVPESTLKTAISGADGLGDVYAAAAGWDYGPYRSMPAAGTGAYFETAAGDFAEAAAGSYYETGEPVEGVGSYYETADGVGAAPSLPGRASIALPPAARAPGISPYGDANGNRQEQPAGRQLGRDRPGGVFATNVFGI